MSRKIPNASEMGKVGGARKYAKYGKSEYSSMGKKGGNKLKQERGSDYFREIRRIGIEKQRKAKEQNTNPISEQPLEQPQKPMNPLQKLTGLFGGKKERT